MVWSVENSCGGGGGYNVVFSNRGGLLRIENTDGRFTSVENGRVRLLSDIFEKYVKYYNNNERYRGG